MIVINYAITWLYVILQIEASTVTIFISHHEKQLSIDCEKRIKNIQS